MQKAFEQLGRVRQHPLLTTPRVDPLDPTGGQPRAVRRGGRKRKGEAFQGFSMRGELQPESLLFRGRPLCHL